MPMHLNVCPLFMSNIDSFFDALTYIIQQNVVLSLPLVVLGH